VGEEELDQPTGPGVTERTARRAVACDAIDDVHGLVVQGHHTLAVQLAKGYLEPGSLAGHLVDAVELEVYQLADAQPGRSLEEQRVGEEPMR